MRRICPSAPALPHPEDRDRPAAKFGIRAGFLATALLAWPGPGPGAQADEFKAAENAGWSFQVTPYLWGAGLEGKVATRSGLPSADIDASFRDILENTDIALMLAGEARYRRWGMFGDITYLSLSAHGDTPGPRFSGVDSDSDTLIATLGLTYRVIDRDRGWLDLVAGGRAWSVDTDVTFEPGLLPKRKSGVTESWADPILGLRGRIDLGSGFTATAYGDVGGGESDLTWQLLGTVGYQFNDHVSARVGYRHLSVDYDQGGFLWNVDLSGPIVGLTIDF